MKLKDDEEKKVTPKRATRKPTIKKTTTPKKATSAKKAPTPKRRTKVSYTYQNTKAFAKAVGATATGTQAAIEEAIKAKLGDAGVSKARVSKALEAVKAAEEKLTDEQIAAIIDEHKLAPEPKKSGSGCLVPALVLAIVALITLFGATLIGIGIFGGGEDSLANQWYENFSGRNGAFFVDNVDPVALAADPAESLTVIPMPNSDSDMASAPVVEEDAAPAVIEIDAPEQEVVFNPEDYFEFPGGEIVDTFPVENGFTVATLDAELHFSVPSEGVCHLNTGGGILNGTAYRYDYVEGERQGLIIRLNEGDYIWQSDVSGNLECLYTVTTEERENAFLTKVANMFDPMSLNCGDSCTQVQTWTLPGDARANFSTAPVVLEEVEFVGSSFEVFGEYVYVVAEGDPEQQGVRLECVSDSCTVNGESWDYGDSNLFRAPQTDNNPATDNSMILDLEGDFIVTEYRDGQSHSVNQ